ncbi:hypothetical protein V1511DRAFT_497847 [Dipodascopsis uninucleata]
MVAIKSLSMMAVTAASVATATTLDFDPVKINEMYFERPKHHDHSHGANITAPTTHNSGNYTSPHKHTKRTTTCAFPSDDGLVSVTPGSSNGGWAMSPDQSCTAGSWCPYACPPGQVSLQWDPSATSYTYPQSQYGGLYCNDDGTVSKGFSDKAYCQDGTGTVSAQSSAGNVAFCQTVLPGNEAMLIPTEVGSGSTTLAVPGPSYWAGTAAHYYVNPPGVSTSDGCVWGSTANPYGNWSPYVAGANTDSSGTTYVKLGWNPVYLQSDSPFKSTLPNWGLNITCPDGGCSGLPCGIDPSVDGVNEISSSSTGAGGATFCVVGVQSGKSANIEVFSSSSSSKAKRDDVDDTKKTTTITSTVATTATTAPSAGSEKDFLGDLESLVSIETVPVTETETETTVVYKTVTFSDTAAASQTSFAYVTTTASAAPTLKHKHGHHHSRSLVVNGTDSTD